MIYYLGVPILIIIGLCLFSYAVGRYMGKNRRREEPKPTADTSALEEENRKLKILVENKDRELAAQSKLVQSALKEHNDLISSGHQEFIKRVDTQREEVLTTIKLKKRISQLESELQKNGIAIPDTTFIQ